MTFVSLYSVYKLQLLFLGAVKVIEKVRISLDLEPDRTQVSAQLQLVKHKVSIVFDYSLSFTLLYLCLTNCFDLYHK